MHKVFCTDQFNNLHIKSSHPGTVVIGPCCNTAGTSVAPDKFDYHSHPYLSEIRECTKNNQRAKACQNCWNHEDAGGVSRRQNGRSNTENYRGTGIEKIDWTTQNICNLACVHCSSYSSSLWAKLTNDQSSSRQESYQDKITMFRALDLSAIRHIHVTGGEPLMTTEHLKILDILQSTGRISQVSASYNTNCTFAPSQEAIDFWKKLRRVNLICSIDAVGAAAEILRWPCDWQQVDRVMKVLLELRRTHLPNMFVTLNATVANYNFLELGEIIQWLQSLDPSIFINWQLVNQNWMHPSCMPDVARTQALRTINSNSSLAEWARAFQRPNDKSQVYWDQTVKWLDSLDQQRNHDWKSVLRIGALV